MNALYIPVGAHKGWERSVGVIKFVAILPLLFGEVRREVGFLNLLNPPLKNNKTTDFMSLWTGAYPEKSIPQKKFEETWSCF